MSRQPAVVELVGGKSKRQRVWEAIRRFEYGDPDGPRSFSVEALSRASKIEEAPVRDYLKGLEAADYIVNYDSDGRGRVKSTWVLVQDNGVEAPRVRRDGSPVTQGSGTQAMWMAMTALDSFNHHFVAELADVRPATVAAYCAVLGKTGYLEVISAGKGIGKGGIATLWRVAQAHREKQRAPMITRLKAVYDPNIHELVWAEGADEAAELVEIGGVVE